MAGSTACEVNKQKSLIYYIQSYLLCFQIGTFLYRKLGRAGLVLYLQTFHYTSTSGTSEAGVNIVGVLPGARWIEWRI